MMLLGRTLQGMKARQRAEPSRTGNCPSGWVLPTAGLLLGAFFGGLPILGGKGSSASVCISGKIQDTCILFPSPPTSSVPPGLMKPLNKSCGSIIGFFGGRTEGKRREGGRKKRKVFSSYFPGNVAGCVFVTFLRVTLLIKWLFGDEMWLFCFIFGPLQASQPGPGGCGGLGVGGRFWGAACF